MLFCVEDFLSYVRRYLQSKSYNCIPISETGDAQKSPAEYIVASHFILPEITCNQVKELQLYTMRTSEMGMLKTVLQSTYLHLILSSLKLHVTAIIELM